MKTIDFDYQLPAELIAQNPLKNREEARLMVLNKGQIKHCHIYDLTKILDSNDVLVFNQTKVFPARLHGQIEGKEVEILLHREIKGGTWECLVKPGKKFIKGALVDFKKTKATVIQINGDGSRLLKFDTRGHNLDKIIDQIGEMPLPPYIKNSQSTPDQYQTTYAKERGSVAAPTAGLHFTKKLLKKLHEKGVEQYFVTLHVGRGTFEPVKTDLVADHKMHSEWFSLSPKTAAALNQAKQAGKKIIAVGTTTNRVLESCTKNNLLIPQNDETDLFIIPGYKFKFVDSLITNFHLPKSTLLMLVSALAGKKQITKAYQTAIKQKYRFFSFGDAMLIL